MAKPYTEMDLITFQRRFGTEKACRKRLFELRWPDGFRCPQCGCHEAYFLERITSFTYDANGRRTGIVRPDSSTIDFSYDNNGNLTSLIVPNASEHTFGYTEVNRNSQYDVPADSGLAENIYHYDYDNDRRPSLHGRARSCPRATRS